MSLWLHCMWLQNISQCKYVQLVHALPPYTWFVLDQSLAWGCFAGFLFFFLSFFFFFFFYSILSDCPSYDTFTFQACRRGVACQRCRCSLVGYEWEVGTALCCRFRGEGTEYRAGGSSVETRSKPSRSRLQKSPCDIRFQTSRVLQGRQWLPGGGGDANRSHETAGGWSRSERMSFVKTPTSYCAVTQCPHLISLFYTFHLSEDGFIVVRVRSVLCSE